MKNIITLLLVSILFILINSHVSNIFVKSNKIFNLKNKNDKIATIRKLGEEDTGESGEEGDETDYVTTSLDEEEKNETILEPPTENDNAGINCVKVYKYNYNNQKITFNMIFSFIKTKVVRYIIFYLSINPTLRILEDENDGKTICTIIDENELDSQNINVKYSCVSNYTRTGSFTIKGGSNFQKGNDENNLTPIEEGEINFSQNAAREFKDIQKHTEDINYSVTLNDGTLKDVSKKRFIIKGKIDGNYGDIKGDKNVTLTLYPNGEAKEVDCVVIMDKQTNYQIRCTPSEEFNANLHLTSGITENKNQIVLNMTKDNKNLSLEEAPSTMNRVYKKSSESGLNGGGIAGIVIACVVALVIASIVAIMLRKPKPPVQSTSTVVQANSVDNLNS